MDKIECQTCGWTGGEDQLEARWSSEEPGCPSCHNNDFMPLEDEEDWED